MSSGSEVTETEIWHRIIAPQNGDLPIGSAREWLRLRLSEMDRARVKELSIKANSGLLSSAEDRELEHYLNVGRALELLKAKARLSLSRQP